MTFLLVALAAAPTAACAAPAREPVVIRLGNDKDRCAAFADGRLIEIEDGLDLRQWRDREIRLKGGADTPYRCVGALIFVLQRSGAGRIGFISEPASTGGTSNER